MIIHLKHNQTFEPNSINTRDRDYWNLISQKYTQCWTKLKFVQHSTTDITKVTCEECINCHKKAKKSS